MTQSQPRGIRNRNPATSTSSHATTGKERGGRFAIFDTPENGIRALGKLLINYRCKDGMPGVGGKGIDTVQETIKRQGGCSFALGFVRGEALWSVCKCLRHSFASPPFGGTVRIDGKKADHEGLPGRSLGKARTLLCTVGGKTMPEREKRYRAYKLLRELDSLTSSTMNQVAYGRLGGPDWQAMCKAHRAAFTQWIEFAESLSSASEANEGCEPLQLPSRSYTKNRFV